jgi:prephenate dehydrogenase
MKTKKIGFIGGGNMAHSLISGLIASGHSAQQIWVCNPVAPVCTKAGVFGIQRTIALSAPTHLLKLCWLIPAAIETSNIPALSKLAFDA